MAFWRQQGRGPAGPVLVELAAGDGLVGSPGVWLESEGVRCFLWEHREIPRREAKRQRPAARVEAGRLLDWRKADLPAEPWLVSSACPRQSARVWQAIREKLIRPAWVVIGNPSGRPVWWLRARQAGYRLAWVYENREYFLRA